MIYQRSTKNMSSLVWEVIMTRNGAIKNAFFQTLKDAKKYYHEWESIDWKGDIYRREY